MIPTRKGSPSALHNGTTVAKSTYPPRSGGIREKNGRDSRKSCPLHRVLDLAILIVRAKQHFQEAYRYEKLYDPEKPVIDRVGLQGDAMTVAICTDNEKIDEDIQLFRQALSNDDELIGERLHTLSRLLKEMGY